MFSDVLSIIALSILSIVITLLTVRVITDKVKMNTLHVDKVQRILDMQVMNEKLAELEDINYELSMHGNDDFVKFLSSSRDWAYSYIEDVQVEIKKFSETAGPEILYYETYGQSVSSPHSEMLDKIAMAYKDLVTLLPKNESDILSENKENK